MLRMTTDSAISEHLRPRLQALTERMNLSASDLVADALENGRSLAWQERFVDTVVRGIEAADRGDFAGEDEIAAVLDKYRPAG